jgi:hypothetical protein
MSISKSAVVLLLVGIALGTVSAQTKSPRVDRRERRQNARIEEGVKSGELTKREAATLNAQQEKIKKDEMKAKADGTLSPAERMKLKREQNRANRRIFRKKHNDVEKPGVQ